ncbi:hypothetical protein N7486_000387 [Penicillium sp. IBT 16267x]|nr:hypothetical protein N7486_000387 [Penicillium sp. IBT 16267x]
MQQSQDMDADDEEHQPSLQTHETGRQRDQSPMQQDSKWDGEPLVGKSRAELAIHSRAKAVAESLEALAGEPRYKQAVGNGT